MRLLTFFGAGSILLASHAIAGPPTLINGPAQGPYAKIQAELSGRMNEANETHKTRVIVSLNESIAKGRSRAEAIAKRQGRVFQAFSAENSGQGLDVLTSYRTLFGFSAELTKGQINALTRHSDVAFIEVMPVHQKLYNESFPLTDVNLAQNNLFDGTGAVIAIIDDSHPAFGGKFLGGYDFADNDSDPTNDCLAQSHGTAVAGVAPAANFVFLKIQSASICGSNSLEGISLTQSTG